MNKNVIREKLYNLIKAPEQILHPLKDLNETKMLALTTLAFSKKIKKQAGGMPFESSNDITNYLSDYIDHKKETSNYNIKILNEMQEEINLLLKLLK